MGLIGYSVNPHPDPIHGIMSLASVLRGDATKEIYFCGLKLLGISAIHVHVHVHTGKIQYACTSLHDNI